MQVIRSATYKRMPWKNGGGETTEIAVSPAGADFTTMDWRLSMATVTTDGPFSPFPGIDRTLTVLAGSLGLEIGNTRVELNEASDPFPFSGDVPVRGIVTRGPVTDLNVMTRRDRVLHKVRRVEVAVTASLLVPLGTVAVFCHRGAVSLSPKVNLEALDTAIGPAPGTSLDISARVPATLYVISIEKR
jgi:environmental stress-induced protein Ves